MAWYPSNIEKKNDISFKQYTLISSNVTSTALTTTNYTFTLDIPNDEYIISAEISTTGWAGLIPQGLSIISSKSVNVTVYNTTSAARTSQWGIKIITVKGAKVTYA